VSGFAALLIGKAKLSHVDFGSPDKVEKMVMKAGCMQPGVGSFEDWGTTAQSTQLLGGAVELTLFYDFKWI